jgi:low affinity Fe/Cu permease
MGSYWSTVWLFRHLAASHQYQHEHYYNTSTSIITFLMVFVIQNTKDRDRSSHSGELDELAWVSP